VARFYCLAEFPSSYLLISFIQISVSSGPTSEPLGQPRCSNWCCYPEASFCLCLLMRIALRLSQPPEKISWDRVSRRLETSKTKEVLLTGRPFECYNRPAPVSELPREGGPSPSLSVCVCAL